MKYLIWDDQGAVMDDAELLKPNWTVEAANIDAAIRQIEHQLRRCHADSAVVFDGGEFRSVRVETVTEVHIGAATDLTELMGGETDHADILAKLKARLA